MKIIKRVIKIQFQEGLKLKEYQDLIGKIIIALAIIISGILIANALKLGFSSIHSALVGMGELIRDGLLQGFTP